MNCLGNVRSKDQAKMLHFIVTLDFLGQVQHTCGWQHLFPLFHAAANRENTGIIKAERKSYATNSNVHQNKSLHDSSLKRLIWVFPVIKN